MRNQKEFFSFVTYPKICHTTDEIFGKLSIVSLSSDVRFWFFYNVENIWESPQFCRNGNGARPMDLFLQICNTLLCQPVLSFFLSLALFCFYFFSQSIDRSIDSTNTSMCYVCSPISIFFFIVCKYHWSTILNNFHKYAINMKIYAVAM